MEKKKKFYYPITKSSLDGFAARIFKPIRRGQSVTAVFLPEFGGARAWVKFIIKNIDLFKKAFPDPRKYKLCFIDPAEIPQPNSLGYLLLIYFQLGGRAKDFDLVSHLELLEKIKEKIRKEKEIVFFICKPNEIPFWDVYLANNLKGLWQVDKQKIHFVFLLTEAVNQERIEEKYGSLSEVILQNVFEVKAIGKEDSLYSIDRWEHLFEAKFSQREKKAIFRVAGGCPYLTKVCCQALVGVGKIKDPVLFLQNQALVKFIKNKLRGKREALTLNRQTGDILQGGKPIGVSLGAKEYEILKLFLEKESQVVSRDDLAERMWGKLSYEKYSDWAIDQMIAQIRKKLLEIGISGVIKAIRGRGYRLCQKGK